MEQEKLTHQRRLRTPWTDPNPHHVRIAYQVSLSVEFEPVRTDLTRVSMSWILFIKRQWNSPISARSGRVGRKTADEVKFQKELEEASGQKLQRALKSMVIGDEIARMLVIRAHEVLTAAVADGAQLTRKQFHDDSFYVGGVDNEYDWQRKSKSQAAKEATREDQHFRIEDLEAQPVL